METASSMLSVRRSALQSYAVRNVNATSHDVRTTP